MKDPRESSLSMNLGRSWLKIARLSSNWPWAVTQHANRPRNPMDRNKEVRTGGADFHEVLDVATSLRAGSMIFPPFLVRPALRHVILVLSGLAVIVGPAVHRGKRPGPVPVYLLHRGGPLQGIAVTGVHRG